MTPKKSITIHTIVHSSIENVWKCWTSPEHITKWNHASDDWHCPKARNDLKVGGTFSATMAAKDGSVSFDFEGKYSVIKNHELIEYSMSDGRVVKVVFSKEAKGVKVTETFDMENMNSEEMQRQGWQAILNNFKKHAESH